MNCSFDCPSGRIDLVLPEEVHSPPPSTVELAFLLDIKPGEKVLELGCGSGLLSITAARLGASRVVATDLDSRALAATALNARHNGVADVITLYEGSWYEALPDNDRGPFDVILANPPQTPGPFHFGRRHGGIDGTEHLLSVIDGAPGHLESFEGRLWLLAISLADPSSLMKRLQTRFAEVAVVKETDRLFTPDEYERLYPGLFDYLSGLRDAGRAEYRDTETGDHVFVNRFIRAAGALNA